MQMSNQLHGYTVATSLSQEEQNKLALKMRIISAKYIPFLSDLIYSTNIQFIEEKACFTDGKCVYIGVPFLKMWPTVGPYFLFLHETLHMALQHIPRFFALQGSPPEHALSNVLADSVINDTLIEILKTDTLGASMDWNDIQNFGVTSYSLEKTLNQLLVSGWHDKLQIQKINYKNIDHSFAVLRHLLKPHKQITLSIGAGAGSNGNGNNSGGGDDDDSYSGRSSRAGHILEDVGKLGSGATKQEVAETNNAIHRKVVGGMIGSTMRGTKSSKLQELIDAIWNKQKIDWKKILANHIKSKLRGTRTWAKLHKKSFSGPAIMPGVQKMDKYSIMVAVDVSGSVSAKQVKEFLSQIYWLTKKYKATVDYCTFDVKVNQTVLIKTAKDVDQCLVVEGRGGTSYLDVFERAARKRVKELVVLTDGYGDQTQVAKPKFKTWWIVDNDHVTFPFGKTMVVDTYD